MDHPKTLSCWRCPAASLRPGQSVKFHLDRADQTVEGFLVNWEGRYFAYVNRCAHVGTPLDLWPNDFFTEDSRHLICATHGAVYRPDDGVCVAGPCVGASLTPLRVTIDGEFVVVTLPLSSAGGSAPAP